MASSLQRYVSESNACDFDVTTGNSLLSFLFLHLYTEIFESLKDDRLAIQGEPDSDSWDLNMEDARH